MARHIYFNIGKSVVLHLFVGPKLRTHHKIEKALPSAQTHNLKSFAPQVLALLLCYNRSLRTKEIVGKCPSPAGIRTWVLQFNCQVLYHLSLLRFCLLNISKGCHLKTLAGNNFLFIGRDAPGIIMTIIAEVVNHEEG